MDLRLEEDLSLADQIHNLLEEAILAQKIPLGSRLVENELAEKLAVSRAPLREALRRLHFEGLARTIARRGTYVIELSAKDVVDVLQIREQLECLAARLAAENISEAELDRLSQSLDNVRETIRQDRHEGYPPHDLDFHQTLQQASGNAKIPEILRSIYRQVQLVRQISGAQPRRAVQALEEHYGIIEALRARDPDLAEARMRRHLRASEKNILHTLKLNN